MPDDKNRHDAFLKLIPFIYNIQSVKRSMKRTMCLILFSYKSNSRYRLVFGGNRDEFYCRPTKRLSFWDDAPGILAGQDLKGMGTWLGLTHTGRFAAITNYRDPASIKDNAPTRGSLVKDYLTGNQTPEAYLENIKSANEYYNGFNLITGNKNGICYYSNKADDIIPVKPGFYGLSNHLLNTPWPKVKKSLAAFKKLISDNKKIDPENIFRILGDTSHPPLDQLPDTGVGHVWEHILSSIFIRSKTYGTRSSSIILIEYSGKTTFIERTFIPTDMGEIKHDTVKFNFTIQ